MNISNRDIADIKQLITDAEEKSNSELIPMIVGHSDLYPAAQFRSAIIVSFIFSVALYLSPFSIINPIWFLWVQIPGLLLGYTIGCIPSFTRFLITKREIEYEVTQRAIEAFFDHNLHTTEKHNGVLIFISLMERKIKIITDVGVREKIAQNIWDEMIADFTAKIKDDGFVEALKGTIIAASTILENYFPADGKPKNNEIKNDLIIED
jgi:putative membrane protein